MEGLRGILEDAEIDAEVHELQQQHAKVSAALYKVRVARSGVVAKSGAVAQGDGAKAVGERGAMADYVGGDIHTGDKIGTQNQYFAAPEQPDSVGQATERYLRKLFVQCNALPLAALGGADDEQVTLQRLYTPLDTTSQIETEGDDATKQLGRIRGDNKRPLAALEAATQQRRLVLLGDPGSGKSSFVRQLVAWAAAERLGEAEPQAAWGSLIPFMLTLREVAAELDVDSIAALDDEAQQDAQLRTALFAAWHKQLRQMQADALLDVQLETWLQAGDVLLVFDGLDEVAEAVRPWIRQALIALLRDYPAVERVIVTCRVRSYTAAAALDSFHVERLAPFTRAQIETFIKRWYGLRVELGHISADEGTKRASDLVQVAIGDEPVRVGGKSHAAHDNGAYPYPRGPIAA